EVECAVTDWYSSNTEMRNAIAHNLPVENHPDVFSPDDVLHHIAPRISEEPLRPSRPICVSYIEWAVEDRGDIPPARPASCHVRLCSSDGPVSTIITQMK